MLPRKGSSGSTEATGRKQQRQEVWKEVLEVKSSVLFILSQLCLLFHWQEPPESSRIPKQHMLNSRPLSPFTFFWPHLPAAITKAW